jgi:hypothetical protein
MLQVHGNFTLFCARRKSRYAKTKLHEFLKGLRLHDLAVIMMSHLKRLKNLLVRFANNESSLVIVINDHAACHLI